MKTIEIEALSLEEMTSGEAIVINGGLPILGPVIDFICGLISGGLFGYTLYRATHVDEYYGGELEPAYCYGEQ